MEGSNRLMAKTIYGCGLRLRERVNLRIKDIDFSRMAVTMRGKGDRETRIAKRFFREASKAP